MADFTKNLITDVFHAYYYIDGKLVFMSKNLTKGNLSQKVSTEEVRNGRGNSLFSILNTDKTTEIVCTENTFNFSTLAMLNGTEIIKGSTVGYTDEVELVVDSSLSIKLPQTPLGGTILNMQINNKDVDGNLNGDKVVFSSGIGIKEGDKVTVYPYEVNTSEDTEYMIVNANEFPEGGVLVLKTKEVSPKKKIVADIEFICENVLCTGEYKIDTTSKVQANDSDITMKVMQMNDKGDMYRIVRKPRNTTSATAVKPISDLVATVDNTAKTATLTFTAPDGATDVDIQYSIDGGKKFDAVTVGGSTGVRVSSSIISTNNTTTISGLTTGSYVFRLVITGGAKAGLSNITNPVTVS